MSTSADWPNIPYAAWKDTCATLQLFTQVVGKIRLQQTPWLNYSWHVPLYVDVRGLTTTAIPWGDRSVTMTFDLLDDHGLSIETSDGGYYRVPLEFQSVADFYRRVMEALSALGLRVAINTTPNEIADPIPFEKDTTPRAYNPVAVTAFWRALVQVDRVFKRFRTGFLGKASPVHLFWGSFDLAVTRFSGRTAPSHPGGIPHLPDAVTREAYSHEVSSAGFWPGGNGVDYPAFYSYAYPSPEGFKGARVGPAEAFFHPDLGEFILPYDAVRNAADPDAALLAFLQSTYDAAADLAAWDRSALECDLGKPGVVRPV